LPSQCPTVEFTADISVVARRIDFFGKAQRGGEMHDKERGFPLTAPRGGDMGRENNDPSPAAPTGGDRGRENNNPSPAAPTGGDSATKSRNKAAEAEAPLNDGIRRPL